MIIQQLYTVICPKGKLNAVNKSSNVHISRSDIFNFNISVHKFTAPTITSPTSFAQTYHVINIPYKQDNH